LNHNSEPFRLKVFGLSGGLRKPFRLRRQLRQFFVFCNLKWQAFQKAPSSGSGALQQEQGKKMGFPIMVIIIGRR
jgi:hypothetical protein